MKKLLLASVLAIASFPAPADAAQCSSRNIPACSELLRALASRVVDCEFKAANRYDDGRSTRELASQIIGMCSVVRFQERQTYFRLFGIRLDDPETDLQDLQQAIEIIDMARKNRDVERKVQQ
jgi:hypothetical protein